MNHYKKGKNVEEELTKDKIPIANLPTDFLWMHVKGGTKVSNVVEYAINAFNSNEYRTVVWSGSGGGVTKTISCAEIMKRDLPLHQVTRLCYQKIEEFWEPTMKGLEEIVATRQIPCIHILLTMDETYKHTIGYQFSKTGTTFWIECPDTTTHDNQHRKYQKNRPARHTNPTTKSTKPVHIVNKVGAHSDHSINKTFNSNVNRPSEVHANQGTSRESFNYESSNRKELSSMDIRPTTSSAPTPHLPIASHRRPFRQRSSNSFEENNVCSSTSELIKSPKTDSEQSKNVQMTRRKSYKQRYSESEINQSSMGNGSSRKSHRHYDSVQRKLSLNFANVKLTENPINSSTQSSDLSAGVDAKTINRIEQSK